MNGSRKLTAQEVVNITNKFTNLRDKLLVVLGLNTGFRISELLSIRVCDIIENKYIRISKSKMKGKHNSRTVPLNNVAQTILLDYIVQNELQSQDYLFLSRKGENQPISRVQAHRILKSAINALQLQGKVSTHSMRKTFAHKVYEAADKDVRIVQKALGHASLSSTTHYLGVDQDEVDTVILSI